MSFHITTTSSVVLAVVFHCVAALPLVAQGPRGVPPKPPPGTRWSDVDHDVTRVVVKFVEGHAVRLDGAKLHCSTLDLRDVAQLVGTDVRIERVFERDVARLDRERAELLLRLPADLDPPADLANWYRFVAKDAQRGAVLLDRMLAMPIVEAAFPDHRPTVNADPGDILPPTPSFTARQGYRDPAPNGIDHRASRVIPGGRGEGIQFTDIETGWYLDHEDIPQLTAAAVVGANPTPRDHGLAVVGELASEWDRVGTTGIVDLVAVKVHSHQSVNWASSVNVAAANTPVGGVVVLEVQLPWNGRTVLMESRQDVFDAVRNAVMAGKHVIAAAGNGSQNLDDPFFQRIFDRTFRDSGAIVVGATEGSQLVRASFSNHGSMVDANGWGRDVATTGYGDLFFPNGDRRQTYTAVFSGTSSATPIVTGAAIALMGALREQKGVTLTSSQLRALLRQHGTPVPNGNIGVRPDLRALLASQGLPNGLDLPREGDLGTAMELELTAPAGAQYAVAGALDRGSVDLGAAGRFLLDPNGTFALWAGIVPANGRQRLGFTYPNDLSLRGSSLFLQAGIVESGALRLTSSVRNFVP
jgi:hypothetical protein